MNLKGFVDFGQGVAAFEVGTWPLKKLSQIFLPRERAIGQIIWLEETGHNSYYRGLIVLPVPIWNDAPIWSDRSNL